MHGSKRCIFLAGAPHGEALKWDEQGLLSHFEPPIQRFLGREDSTRKRSTAPTPTGLHAKWRSVACDDFGSRPSNLYHGLAQDKLGKSNGNLKERSHFEDFEFLEHSIAVLDNLDSSQIISTADGEQTDANADVQTIDISFTTTSLTDTSIQTSNDSLATASPTQDEGNATTAKIAGGITDLKRLPKADHITRILPQTITVNILVGIITVSPSRTVRLRRRNAEMDIIELTVGDETRAGFSISFWLVPIESQKPLDDLRENLRRLRSGQVVLLQNVALSCWKGNVYGQSLSKRFARNSTTIYMIGDKSRQRFSTPVVSKLRRVQDWAADFVGVVKRRTSFDEAGKTVKKRKMDELPPDTQD